MLSSPTFPSTLISIYAEYRTRSGPSGLASIHVQFDPFEFDGELVHGPIRLERIDIDLSDLPALAGRRFALPDDPAESYFDGSLYVHNRRCPYYVTMLAFGDLRGNSLALTVTGILELAQQPEWPLTVHLQLYLPLDDAAIDELAARAIEETGTASPSEAGKVMAHLALRYLDSPYMERLSRAVARQLEAR